MHCWLSLCVCVFVVSGVYLCREGVQGPACLCVGAGKWWSWCKRKVKAHNESTRGCDGEAPRNQYMPTQPTEQLSIPTNTYFVDAVSTVQWYDTNRFHSLCVPVPSLSSRRSWRNRAVSNHGSGRFLKPVRGFVSFHIPRIPRFPRIPLSFLFDLKYKRNPFLVIIKGTRRPMHFVLLSKDKHNIQSFWLLHPTTQSAGDRCGYFGFALLLPPYQ